jgi:hypothetical protein
LGLFLLGTFARRASAMGALLGMFLGLAAILSVFRFTTVAYTWYVLIGASVTFLCGGAISLFFPSANVAASRGEHA